MTTTEKDPEQVLRDAILICGDCPECGSDNWTDDEKEGECHSCGARFSPTIPRQMLLAGNALNTVLRWVSELREMNATKNQRIEDLEAWIQAAVDHPHVAAALPNYLDASILNNPK